MSRIRRAAAAAVFGLLLTSTQVFAPTASAQAPPVRAAGAQALSTCVGTNTVNFTPGLRLFARPVTISGVGAYSCLSTDPVITSGTSVISGSGVVGCVTSDGTTTEVITWNTGETSTISYDYGIIVQPGGEAVVVIVGHVEAGRFAGSLVTSPGAQVTLNPLQCLSSDGVQLVTGPTTLVIG